MVSGIVLPSLAFCLLRWWHALSRLSPTPLLLLASCQVVLESWERDLFPVPKRVALQSPVVATWVAEGSCECLAEQP
jgi:hypothetical protein